MSLLPMAFTKQGATTVWIDPQAMLLVLDAGSQGRADEVMTCLINAIEGFAVQLINTAMSPAAAMAQWLAAKEAPAGFSVDRECELKAADESKAVVRYTRHALDTDEVTGHIAMGKMPTRLAMTWNDHVSFVLTEALQLKKVAVLDVVFEAAAALASDGQDDNFDGDVAIATGELQKLIPDLLAALGGEVLPIPAV
jgi:recombination associated protein RdgC